MNKADPNDSMKIGIIGAGKVGISIGHVMKDKGLHVAGISDKFENQLNVARNYMGSGLHYTHDNMEIVRSSDVIAITTQDRAITEVAGEIYEKSERLDNKLFFHTSGAHPASIISSLEAKGAFSGSLHPLQTFPDIESAIRVIPDTYIFIDGHEEAIPVLTYRQGNRLRCCEDRREKQGPLPSLGSLCMQSFVRPPLCRTGYYE